MSFKILRMLFSKRASVSKDVQTVIREYLAKNPQAQNKELFCHQVWKNSKVIKTTHNTPYVKYHSDLNHISHHLRTGYNPDGLTEKIPELGVTPKEMVKISDGEFKILPKTNETIITYRGVFENFSPRFSKSLEVKKGDIVTMPEFAYTTSDKSWALRYAGKDSAMEGRGLLYTIEIPPESRVSIKGSGTKNEIVFPRCSQFECIGTEQQGNILVVKLKYIKPVDFVC